jgi:hypothetical protein
MRFRSRSRSFLTGRNTLAGGFMFAQPGTGTAACMIVPSDSTVPYGYQIDAVWGNTMQICPVAVIAPQPAPPVVYPVSSQPPTPGTVPIVTVPYVPPVSSGTPGEPSVTGPIIEDVPRAPVPEREPAAFPWGLALTAAALLMGS